MLCWLFNELENLGPWERSKQIGRWWSGDALTTLCLGICPLIGEARWHHRGGGGKVVTISRQEVGNCSGNSW